MSEENEISKMDRSVPELNAWLVGLLAGAIGMVGIVMEECCHVAGAEDIVFGILLIALGYYWAAIVRELTRDRAVSPFFFAVFFAVLTVLDVTAAVCRSSLDRGMFVVLQWVSSLGWFAGLGYLLVRSWKAAAGMNAPFIARLSVSLILLIPIATFIETVDPSPNEPIEWFELIPMFILWVLLFAGLQYPFNRGLRNHRNPPEQPQYCPLWKALLPGGLCVLLVVVVLVVLGHSGEPV